MDGLYHGWSRGTPVYGNLHVCTVNLESLFGDEVANQISLVKYVQIWGWCIDMKMGRQMPWIQMSMMTHVSSSLGILHVWLPHMSCCSILGRGRSLHFFGSGKIYHPHSTRQRWAFCFRPIGRSFVAARSFFGDGGIYSAFFAEYESNNQSMLWRGEHRSYIDIWIDVSSTIIKHHPVGGLLLFYPHIAHNIPFLGVQLSLFCYPVILQLSTDMFCLFGATLERIPVTRAYQGMNEIISKTTIELKQPLFLDRLYPMRATR